MGLITPNALVLGDARVALTRTARGSIDLIYIDPPFNTGQTRKLDSIELHTGNARRTGFGGKEYQYRVRSSLGYEDSMPRSEYLQFMEQCLSFAREALNPEDGSIYVHVGWHVAHEMKLLLDRVFGTGAYINEIIWAYDYGGRPRNRWAPKHDYIFWYSRTPGRWIFNPSDIDRLPYMAPGLVGPEKAALGKLPTDVWWMTIVPTNSKQRTGYPTQKPEKLLERIIRACSHPGQVVLDFFCGAGTTGIVADRLNRKWLMVDINPAAIEITRGRLDSQLGMLASYQYVDLTTGVSGGERASAEIEGQVVHAKDHRS